MVLGRALLINAGVWIATNGQVMPVDSASKMSFRFDRTTVQGVGELVVLNLLPVGIGMWNRDWVLVKLCQGPFRKKL